MTVPAPREPGQQGGRTSAAVLRAVKLALTDWCQTHPGAELTCTLVGEDSVLPRLFINSQQGPRVEINAGPADIAMVEPFRILGPRTGPPSEVAATLGRILTVPKAWSGGGGVLP